MTERNASMAHTYPDTEPMRRPVAAVLQELSDVIEAVRGDRSIVRVSGLCGNAQDVGVVGIDSLQETIKRACAELTANGAPSVAGRIGKDIAIAICALAAEQSSTPIQSTAQISELDDASNACLELAAKHGYATGHGDTVADMIREFSAQIPLPDPAQSGKLPGLGDLVRLQEASPYYHDWRGVVMKIVSLRIDPDNKLWASVIDMADPRNTRHRGFGIYDGETDGFELDHLEKAGAFSSTEDK